MRPRNTCITRLLAIPLLAFVAVAPEARADVVFAHHNPTVTKGLPGVARPLMSLPSRPGALDTQGNLMQPNLSVWLDRAGAKYPIGSTVQVGIQVDRPAYLTILSVDSAGEIVQIYPNQYSPGRKLVAGGTVLVPGPDAPFAFTVVPPYGPNLIQVIATSEPITRQRRKAAVAPETDHSQPAPQPSTKSTSSVPPLPTVGIENGGITDKGLAGKGLTVTAAVQKVRHFMEETPTSAVRIGSVSFDVVPATESGVSTFSAMPLPKNASSDGISISLPRRDYRASDELTFRVRAEKPCALSVAVRGASGQITDVIRDDAPVHLDPGGSIDIPPSNHDRLRIVTPGYQHGDDTIIAKCNITPVSHEPPIMSSERYHVDQE